MKLFLLVNLIAMGFLFKVNAEALKCPQTVTDDSLEDWRDNAIKAMNSGQYGDVKKGLKDCFKDELPSCLGDLKEHNELKSSPVRDQLGHVDVVDPSDFVGKANVASPEDLPAEFRHKDSSGNVVSGKVSIPKNIFEVAKQKGWKVASYKTRSTGGFDTPPNLLLIAIPGEKKDIFLQISPPPDTHGESRHHPVPKPRNGDVTDGQDTLTIISVDKTQKPPVGQIQIMNKSGQGRAYDFDNKLRSAGCIECHASPLRSISPIGYRVTNGLEQKLPEETQKVVTEINEMMLINGLSWGKTNVNGHKVPLGPNKERPVYGWKSPSKDTRSPDFIKACADEQTSFSYLGFGGYQFEAQMQDKSKINYEKVATAMNCTMCHDNSARGYLHQGFSRREITFKVLVDRSMPPGLDLTQDERMAVINCLNAEINETESDWKEMSVWLKKEACRAPRKNASPMNLLQQLGSGSQSGSK